MSPPCDGLRRPQAGSSISYTNDSPANRHGSGLPGQGQAHIRCHGRGHL